MWCENMFLFVLEAPEYVVKEQSGHFQEICEHEVIFLKESEKMKLICSFQILFQFNLIQ